ncbi:MAG: DUF6361 family protein [Anaerolineales bacterium]
MTSILTWLDYSEHERRRMLDVVRLFRETETRDELGIGSIRDALADLFFPGTSTIQTRARYFLFIPWIYRELEERRTDSSKIADRVRRHETALINALLAAGETEGVIGRIAQDKLQRLPSNIYWQGLGMLGIRMFAGSQDQYHRSLTRYYTKLAALAHQRDEEATDSRKPTNWHLGLPPTPAEFPNGATFALPRLEAEYLRERIQTHAPDSLLAFWVSQWTLPPQSDFPWEVMDDQLPSHLRKKLMHARNFSESMHGAALLYNLLLAEATTRTDWVERYRTMLKEWIDLASSRLRELADWDKPRFWDIVLQVNPRVPRFTRVFVEQWLDLILDSTRLHRLAEEKPARDLIRARERFLKRGQARLENRRALDLWQGEAGTQQLSFRWGVTQRHLQDIHAGLHTR